MAKNFSQFDDDNPVMAVLNAAKEEEKQSAADILSESGNKPEPAAVEVEEQNEEPVVEIKKILMNISIRESTKKEWKMFFLEHDLSMTQGIETAVEYLMSEVKKGSIRLSKGGITK